MCKFDIYILKHKYDNISLNEIKTIHVPSLQRIKGHCNFYDSMSSDQSYT